MHASRPSAAILMNAPAPYRIPFLNELAQHCRLLVAFDTVREPHREWALSEDDFEFDWVLTGGLSLPRKPPELGRTLLHVPLNVGSVLKRFGPDVVISNELGPRTALAAASCRIARRPLIVWWEGTPSTEEHASALAIVRRKLLLRRATRAWGNGQEAAACLERYGFPRARIDLGVTGTETWRWKQAVDDARLTARAARRVEHGLQGTVIAFVGSLTPLKGVPELLAAFDLLAADRDLPPWSALFVGTGPLDAEIDAWAASHPGVPLARPGFVQPPDLAEYYAAADLFVMPTLVDRWSLVGLEALVAGIPQVTSSCNGGAVDLITTSEIGSIVDPTDARALAGHLADRIRAGSPRVPDALRERAAADWSHVAMAQRAMASIRTALEVAPAPRMTGQRGPR